MATTRRLVLVAAAVLLLSGCYELPDDASVAPSPRSSATGAESASGPVRSDNAESTSVSGNDISGCGRDADNRYSGLPGCHPGGDTVTVAEVLDGDTLELTDGRAVQLIGVDAAELGRCAADAATDHVRARVDNRQVLLHREDGVDLDRDGRTLGYIQYDGPDDVYDLGYSLAYNGLAIPYPPYAGNDRYMANIVAAVDKAHAQGRGLFATECAEDDPAEDESVGEDDSDSGRLPPAARVPDPASTSTVAAPPTSRAADPAATSPAYYANCDAVRAAGQAPLHAGEPGYRAGLDRDGDGAACDT